MVPLSYIGAVALLWLVPVHGDVAPLILVLGATITAAVTGLRRAVVYVTVFALAAVGG